MPHLFADDVVTAVLGHMNDDHTDDSLLIVRAFAPGGEDAVEVRMTGFDGDGGEWAWDDAEGREGTARIAWPAGPIDERRAVRREIVALYDAACTRLGVEPRPHD